MGGAIFADAVRFNISRRMTSAGGVRVPFRANMRTERPVYAMTAKAEHATLARGVHPSPPAGKSLGWLIPPVAGRMTLRFEFGPSLAGGQGIFAWSATCWLWTKGQLPLPAQPPRGTGHAPVLQGGMASGS